MAVAATDTRLVGADTVVPCADGRRRRYEHVPGPDDYQATAN
jgi:hypothetical protein